jgi:hypothetical protein
MRQLLCAGAYLLLACVPLGLLRAQPVVVNKYYNAGIGNAAQDAVELLVVQHNADLRGMLIKDFSSSMNADAGGVFQFLNVPLWAAVPAGTLIVLRNDATAADVSALPDFVLDVGLSNAAYFNVLTGSFDIATTDMVMLKGAGAAAAGVAGSLHVLGGGTAGSFYTSAPTPKLLAVTGAGTAEFVIATNATSALADYNGTGAAGGTTGVALGSAHNPANQAYINQLRMAIGSLSLSTNTIAFDSLALGDSAIRTYTVTGSFLMQPITAASNRVDFTLSYNNSAYGPSVTLPQAGGVVSIKFKPSQAGAQTASIVHTSGAFAQTLTATGRTPALAITVQPGVLNFGMLLTGRTAILGAFVSGRSLTQNITVGVAAGSPFALSRDNTTFASAVSLPASGGALFIRYAPQAPANDTLALVLASGTTSGVLPVAAQAEAFNANTAIVVNKFYNATVDAVELLVVRSNTNAQGLVVKDFSNNLTADGGGKYAFAAHPLWGNLRAGTLIVLRNNGSQADTDATDYYLDVGLDNPTFFTNLDATGRFDIAGNDMVMIKAAGAPPVGTAGSLHALAGGAGPLLNAAPLPKLAAPTPAGNGEYVCATTPNRALIDYHGTDALGGQTGLRLGQGNTAANSDYIRSLRAGVTNIEVPAGVNEGEALVYPNPATTEALLRLVLAKPGAVQADVYNVAGGRINTVAWGRQTAGVHTLPLPVADWPAGLYWLAVYLPAEQRYLHARVAVVH